MKNEEKEIKCFLLDEIKADKQDTFMYQLHYENFFDEQKLNELLNKYEKYLAISNQEVEKEIYTGVVNVFLHTFFLFYCHNIKDDLYKIKNYKRINHDNISDYYLKIKSLIFNRKHNE